MGEKVGEGSAAVVFNATWNRSVTVGTKRIQSISVAVKMSNRKNSSEHVTADLARDLAVISSLPHPNILTLHGVCESPDGDPKIVYELMTGDLAKLLKDSLKERTKSLSSSPSPQLLPTQVLLRVLRDVAAGLVHLHEHGVVHRDVKPANVLLLRDEQAKLCDFGSSKDLESTIQQMTVTGTLDYMAPEVLNKDPAGRAADVWAFGVLLFECVTGTVPKRKAKNPVLVTMLQRASCLPPLIKLFEQCHQEAYKRPAMVEIHGMLQRLVMLDARDSQRLKEELKRAEAQDCETFEATWNQHCAKQPRLPDLLKCAKKHALNALPSLGNRYLRC